MHLAEEMIRQTPVVIQSREICATDITDLQFLMPTRSLCVRERFQISFQLFLLNFLMLQIVELLHCQIDAPLLRHDLYFHNTRLDRPSQVANLLKHGCSLSDLVGSLLQPSLRGLDPSIAFSYIRANIALVVEIETPFSLL